MDFSDETVMAALSAHTTKLEAAGVTGVWLDMQGSGWTGEFLITVDAKPETTASAMIAVRESLAKLEPGANVTLRFEKGEQNTRYYGRVWPIASIISVLQRQVASLTEEIARLEAIRNRSG